MSKTTMLIIIFWWFVLAMYHAWFGDNSAGKLLHAFIYFIMIMTAIVYVAKPINKHE